jgi:hypothetical protein
MNRFILAGGLAVALASGGAIAQDSSVSTQSTTTRSDPADSSHSASKSEHSTDTMGNSSSRHESYRSDGSGSSSEATSHTDNADGSQSAAHEEHATSPDGTSSSSESRTTTDTGR